MKRCNKRIPHRVLVDMYAELAYNYIKLVQSANCIMAKEIKQLEEKLDSFENKKEVE